MRDLKKRVGLSLLVMLMLFCIYRPMVARATEETVVASSSEVDMAVGNIAYGKKVTIALNQITGTIREGDEDGSWTASMAVDGIIGNNNYLDFAILDNNNEIKGSAYVQVDLESSYAVESLELYRYWKDGRTYDATVVVVAETEADFGTDAQTIIYNSDTENIHGLGSGIDEKYVETSQGKTFDLEKSVNARYVRIYGNGVVNGVSTNHIVELKVFAMAPTTMITIAGGQCGDNITWQLTGDGTLTISGSGEMWDYDSPNDLWYEVAGSYAEFDTTAPWYKYWERILTLKFEGEITTIGKCAFGGCKNIKGDLVIPESIINIRAHAFGACSGFDGQLIFSKSLQNIGEYAFFHCINLQGNLIIPNSVKEIGSNAFKYCEKLTGHLEIPANTIIGGSAFADCKGFTSLSIPEGMTEIPGSLVDGCTGLTGELVIPETVTSIGAWAFWGCSGFTGELNIPEGVTHIGNLAFRDCRGLTGELNIPEGVTYLGEEAFRGCTGLTGGVTIPEGVTSIGQYTFYDCRGLTGELVLPENLTTIGRFAFYNCKLTGNLYIPESVVSIGDEAFHFCDGFEGKLKLPKGLTKLGERVFSHCSGFTGNLTIPKGVSSLGVYVLNNCHGLTSVTILNPNCSIYSWNSTIAQNAAIYGYADSTAQEYAEKHNKPFYVLPEAYDLPLEEFNLSVYRANKLFDPTIGEGQNLEEYMNMDTPSEIFAQAAQESGFDTGAAVWENVCLTFDTADDITKLYDFTVEEKDIYSAVLLEALEASVEYGVTEQYEMVIKDSKKLVSEINKWAKNLYGIEIANKENWKNLTTEQREQLTKKIEKTFKAEFSQDIQSLNKVFSNFGKMIDAADCVESYIEMVSSSLVLADMCESMKTVIYTMYTECPNGLMMKSALYDCVDIINSSTEAFIEKMVAEGFYVVGENVTKALVDELWDEVKKSLNAGFPALDILLAGYKSGTTVSNIIFNTDDTVEQYHRMLVTLEYEALLNHTYEMLRTAYVADGTAENAEAYLSAIDLMFSFRNQDCINAYEFVDNVDQSLINRTAELLNGESTYVGLRQTIRGIQRDYSTVQESVLTFWIHYLEEDYPDSGLAEQYAPYLEQSISRIKSKEFLVACPVDVYIYDLSGELVAYVESNKPYCNGNLTVTVSGDQKTFTFYNNEEYRMVCVGNDIGTMDTTVHEYDEAGNESRTAYFYDIPLENEKVYETEVVSNTEVYAFTDTEGKETIADADFGNTNTEETYHLKINSGSFREKNQWKFETDLQANERVELWAYVPNGYEFLGWTSDVGEAIFENSTEQVTLMRMPKADVSVEAIIRKIVEKVTEVFVDVPVDAWFADEIQYVFDKGIMTGVSDTTFEPETAVTRATIVQTLYKLEGKPAVSDFTKYDSLNDTLDSIWWKNGLAWALNKGVAKGDSKNNVFNPDNEVTREDLATFIYRYAQYKGVDVELEGTVDEVLGDTFVNSWAKTAFAWAIESGLIKGKTINGVSDLAPQVGATRAELATIMMRFYQNNDL